MRLDATAVSAKLEQDGYEILEALLDEQTLAAVNAEFSQAPNLLPSYDYPFGDQYRIEALEMRARMSESMPATAALLLDGPIADLCAAYGAEEERDLLVWSSEFRRDTDAIYGIPHFDRRHQLKVFVYLTDVNENDGPTHVSTEKPDHFHARWLNAWREALDLGRATDEEVLERVRTTSEDSPTYSSVACEVELARELFVPLTGSAGTVVIFDTSLAHFGGLIGDARGARRTVRRHCLLD